MPRQPSMPRLLAKIPGTLVRQGLSRLTTKAHPVTRALIYFIHGQSPVPTPRDYAHLSKEGYEAQAVVYAAVRAIVQPAARIPLLLYEKSRTRGKPQEIEEHPLLATLGRPNPEEGRMRFRESSLAYLLLAGNSYVNMVGPENGPPRELWLLRPDRMQVIPDATNRIGGYVYAKFTPGAQEFLRDRAGQFSVIHHKLFHPTHDWYGLSVLQVAARQIDAANEATAWNFHLLHNHASPSGALMAKGEIPDYEHAKQELEENFAGSKNSGRPMLLEGDMTWEQFGLTPREMDWLKGLQDMRRMIGIVFHVAPELLGDSAGKTFANVEAAYRDLYEGMIIPLMELILDDWNAQLVPRWGNDRLYLAMDLDAIPALRENQNDLYKRTEEANSLTLNEKRQVLGWSPLENFDMITQPNGMVLLLDPEAQARDGKVRVTQVLIPPNLMPLDDGTLPALPEAEEEPDDVEEGKVLPLPRMVRGVG